MTKQMEDMETAISKLSIMMFDDKLAKAYFTTVQLLKIFRKHIDVVPQSLYGMRQEWERTYPALDADLLERFNEETQAILLKNWDRLMKHADNLHIKLVNRLEKKEKDLASLRDSVSLLIITTGQSLSRLNELTTV